MGKRMKLGKQRKDRFYKLAKETGYRSRASFKLIQLNRKFEFLQRSRVLIDLCAAPGGWLQVAVQSMPVSSLVIGVDLVSIKPIPNTITLQEDITTDKCKQALKKHLKTWKADAILHDGSPNVGKSWLHDAFAQTQLTLSALKLATELLAPGGWFISKVFRSRDYNSLLWAFQKLFKKVHVTKPQASRNESAEIFVICQGYIAPDRLDPRFLDGSSLFKDIEEQGDTKSGILQTAKKHKKPKAEGYDKGDASVYCQLKASNFIFSDNHIDLLKNSTEIIFDDEDIEKHRTTTDDIKTYCKDIRVLGNRELRALLNWRKNLRELIKKQDSDKKPKKASDAENSVEVEELEIDEAVKEAEGLELSRFQELKRKKKKALKEKRKTVEKINLKMIIKDDEPIIQEDKELFNIAALKSKSDLSKVRKGDLDGNSELDKSLENDDEVPMPNFRKNVISYNRHDDHNPWEEENGTEEQVDSEEETEELEFSTLKNDSSDGDDLDSDQEGENRNPLIVDLVGKDQRVDDIVNKWFDKEDFADIEQDEDLDMELLAYSMDKDSKGSKKEAPGVNQKAKISQDVTEDVDNAEDTEDPVDMDDSPAVVPDKITETKTKKKKKRVMLDPEGLALGTLMIRSKKARRDILDNAYNRYAANDEGLPDWFIKDEEKHNRKKLPVSQEMVEEYKKQLREINARPIKKVIEAKTRKKRKALKRLEKARKRAEAITEGTDMSEKEKMDQLRTIYKKAMSKKKKDVTYVVATKGRVVKPKVKGRYKMVDKRMRKDNRKKKAELKSKGKSKITKQKSRKR